MLALTIVPFANSTWVDLCRLSHMALEFPALWPGKEGPNPGHNTGRSDCHSSGGGGGREQSPAVAKGSAGGKRKRPKLIPHHPKKVSLSTSSKTQPRATSYHPQSRTLYPQIRMSGERFTPSPQRQDLAAVLPLTAIISEA